MKSLKVNSKELADLQLIINTYESKIAKDTDGEKVSILAFRPMENTNVALKETYKGIDIGQQMKKQVNEWRSALKDEEKMFNETVDGKKVADAINSILSPKVDDVNRSASGEVAGVSFKTKNTFVGMANAKDLGQSLGVLMKDCIPCNARFEAPSLAPDISLLDFIIDTSNQIVNEVKAIIDSILSPEPTSGDICASVNLFNFTCIPDFNALSIAMARGLKVSIKAPKFKLPGLSDLIGMILYPVLAMLTNLINAWVSLILKPVECVIKSLETLIRKLKLKGGKTGASFTLKEQTLTFSASLALTDAQASAYNKTVVEGTTKGLEAILKVIRMIRDKTLGYFQKITNKYKAIATKSVNLAKGVFENIREVTRILSYLKLIGFIKGLFQVNLTNCNTKEELSKRIYKDIVRREGPFTRGAAAFVARGVSSDGSSKGVTSINLTVEEATAIGFDPPSSQKESQLTVDKGIQRVVSTLGDGFVSVDVKPLYEDDCQISSSREQFYSVNKLMESFS